MQPSVHSSEKFIRASERRRGKAWKLIQNTRISASRAPWVVSAMGGVVHGWCRPWSSGRAARRGDADQRRRPSGPRTQGHDLVGPLCTGSATAAASSTRSPEDNRGALSPRVLPSTMPSWGATYARVSPDRRQPAAGLVDGGRRGRPGGAPAVRRALSRNATHPVGPCAGHGSVNSNPTPPVRYTSRSRTPPRETPSRRGRMNHADRVNGSANAVPNGTHPSGHHRAAWSADVRPTRGLLALGPQRRRGGVVRGRRAHLTPRRGPLEAHKRPPPTLPHPTARLGGGADERAGAAADRLAARARTGAHNTPAPGAWRRRRPRRPALRASSWVKRWRAGRGAGGYERAARPAQA